MRKDPLILLPGTLCDERLWAHQVEQLGDVADVTVGDLTLDNTIEGMARTVLDNAPEKFALAGLSLGGIVAMEVVHQAPDRVTKLAILNSNPYGPTPRQIDTWNHFKQLVKDGRFCEITKEYLLPHLIHPDRQQDKELTAMIIAMADQIGPNAYVRQLDALATRGDSRDRLTKIKCPTILVSGQEDSVCPLRLHKEMNGLIPNSQLSVINHCGHLSTIEQPEIVTSILKSWLVQ